ACRRTRDCTAMRHRDAQPLMALREDVNDRAVAEKLRLLHLAFDAIVLGAGFPAETKAFRPDGDPDRLPFIQLPALPHDHIAIGDANRHERADPADDTALEQV